MFKLYLYCAHCSGLASIYSARDVVMQPNQNIFIQSNIMTDRFLLGLQPSLMKTGKYFYSEKYLTTVRKALVELNKIDIWLDKTSDIITTRDRDDRSDTNIAHIIEEHAIAKKNLENILQKNNIFRRQTKRISNGYKISYAFGSSLLKSTNMICPINVVCEKYEQVISSINQALFVCPAADKSLLTNAALASERCKFKTKKLKVTS